MSDYDRINRVCGHLERGLKGADLSMWPDMLRINLTDDERLTVACTATQALANGDARELLAYLSVQHVPEVPVLNGPMEAARDWVSLASDDERKAFAAAIFGEMGAVDRRKFLAWANSQQAVEQVAAE